MEMTFEFSANTGFLYQHLGFIERIYAAHEDSYDAVEFHDEAQIGLTGAWHFLKPEHWQPARHRPDKHPRLDDIAVYFINNPCYAKAE